MAVTYSISIDADDDFVFHEVADESIATYVIEWFVRLGLTDLTQRMADPAYCEVVLDDRANIFKPEHASSGDALLGRFLQIRANDGSSDYPLFTGAIREIRSDSVLSRATLVCSGRTATLDGGIKFPIMEDVSADEIIDVALTGAEMGNKLGINGGLYWQLDSGLLDTSTYLSGPYHDVTLASGISEFELVGTDYDYPSAREVIRDAVRAEWGYFYEDGSGEIIFANRHAVLEQASAVFNLGTNESLRLSDYGMGPVFNEAVVRFSPVFVDEGVTLWENMAPIRFSVKRPEYRVTFLNSDGRLLAAQSVVVPQNWAFYRDELGEKLVQRTVNYDVTLDGTGAFIRVQIPEGLNHVYLLSDSVNVITGDAWLQADPLRVIKRDEASIVRNGRIPIPFELPNYVDVIYAGDLAAWLAGRYADDTAAARWVDLAPGMTDSELAGVQIDLLDIVNVDIDAIVHDADYGVIGIERGWSSGVLRSRLYLEQVVIGKYWVLGASFLSSDTVLGL